MGIAETLKSMRDRAAGEPRLWVRRFVLFKKLGADFDSSEIIRQDEFKRGVNIVIGVEGDPTESVEQRGAEVHGHSVGKTLFCRLLRHGLGEPRYGTELQKAAIQHTFRQSWLGMEVMLKGVPWAILRQIGEGENSYAAPNLTLRDLVPSEGRKEHQGIDRWREALEAGLASGILGLDGLGVPHTGPRWLKLLQWCARDQEAYFRKLWEWRSKDSSSDPGLLRKDEAVRILRGALGLLDDKGAALEDDLRKVSEELSALDASIAPLKLEPDFLFRMHEKWLLDEEARLRAELKKLRATRDEGSLTETEAVRLLELEALEVDGFDKLPVGSIFEQHAPRGLLERYAKTLVSSRRARLERLREEQRDLDEVLASSEVKLERHESIWARKAAKIAADAKQYSEKELDRRNKLKELQGYLASTCQPVGIDFTACPKFMERLEEAKSGKVQDLAAEAHAAREAAIAARRTPDDEQKRNERARMKGIVEDLRADRDDVLREITLLDRQLPEAISYLAQVHEHLDGKSSAAKQQKGDHSGRPLQKLMASREEADRTKKRLEDARKNSMHRYTARKQQIESLFNDLVGSLLRGGYHGKLALAAHDIRFVIRDSHEVGGVAFETLATVLADLTTMLAGVHGTGSHPGFLVHDSPREGDLAGNIYSEFFRVIFGIHDALGGENSAPFQYIVTTTTKPPTREDLVRMRLQKVPASETLFRTALTAPAATGAADLLEQEEGN